MSLQTFLIEMFNTKNGFNKKDFEFNVKPYSKTDFHAGVKVDRTQIDEWRHTVLKYLSENNDRSTFIRSGNAMVIGYRNTDGGIKIFEFTTGYVEMSYKLPE